MELTKACKELMIKEPLYGLFLLNLNKVITDSPSIPTLAVGIEGINTVLFVNDTFWKGLTDEQQLAVLKHEIIHICYSHLVMRHSFTNHELFNIAADLEVNQYITGLPPGCLDYREMNIPLNPNAGTKYYYEELKKNQDQLPQWLQNLINGQGCPQCGCGSGDGEGDDSGCGSGGTGKCTCGKGNFQPDKNGDIHPTWKSFDELDDATRRLVDNQTKHTLKECANQVMKGRGTIPGEFKELIDKLFKKNPPVFNWRSYFRRLMGSSYKVFTKKSQRKLSKRFEDNAGIKIKQKHKVLVAIDTSGSVNKRELAEFFSEIHHIYKAGVAVDIMEVDTKIQKMYEYDGKFSGEIHGRGGTNFTPAIDFFNENRAYTTLIYFTDGYAPTKGLKPNKPMIWVITSNGEDKQEYPGHVIRIPKNYGRK